MHSFITLPLLISLLLPPGPAARTAAETLSRKVSYLSYDEARPILESLKEALPPQLRSAAEDRLASVWQDWVASRDAQIRGRLVQGDEDSLVNFLLFGTSYTRRPRITLEDLARAGQKSDSAEAPRFLEAIKLRAGDLAQGMLAPESNERLLFARRVVEGKGYDLKGQSAREQLKLYLLASLARVLNEQASYAKLLESARTAGNSSEEFAARSKLFKDRGLSSDTSLMPNFAIERSLVAIKTKGLLSPGSVRRVAIVGPGLDFTDKQDGYDFYPQQTIQPFAIIDTLLRLGLADANQLRVTTLDLSPRINDHISRARARAAHGAGYVVQLPRDSRWKPGLLGYWSEFGNQIGSPAATAPVPQGLGGVKVRAVSIRPVFVSLVSSEDVNIVLQRLELPAVEQFDLILATNILVYYDVFEQSLALANIERMLRPRGLLLSNNALLELPGSGMHSIGYETVVFSDRPGDGDHIVWYQRSAAR